MTMGEIIKWFGSGYFGSALGILGILAGLITFYASRKRKILTYGYKKTVIMKNFKNKINGLEVKYNNHSIKNLSSTNIGIWNKGRDPIKRDDIAPRDPIAIQFREEIIGEPELIFIKTASNQISLKKSGNKIILDFDFLDFGDGATIQIFHTSELILDPESVSQNSEQGIDIDKLLIDFPIMNMNTTENAEELEPEQDSSISIEYVRPFYITGKVIGSQEKIKLTDAVESFKKNLVLTALPLVIYVAISDLFKLSSGSLWGAPETISLGWPILILAIPLTILVVFTLRFWFIRYVYTDRDSVKTSPRVIDTI